MERMEALMGDIFVVGVLTVAVFCILRSRIRRFRGGQRGGGCPGCGGSSSMGGCPGCGGGSSRPGGAGAAARKDK